MLHNLAVTSPVPSGNIWKNECGIFRPSNYKLSCLDSDDATLLLTVYNLMYRNINYTLKDLSQLIENITTIALLLALHNLVRRWKLAQFDQQRSSRLGIPMMAQ